MATTKKSDDKGAPEQPRFPRRDEDGRVESLMELIVFTMMVLVVGVVMLSIVDGLFALFDFGTFGQISGWISGLLAVFVFIDDFRAYRDERSRWLVAAVAVLLSLVAGLGVLSVLPDFWLPLYNGAVSVAVSALLYAVLWFTGVRLLGGRR